jgi:hypothetical protein
MTVGNYIDLLDLVSAVVKRLPPKDVQVEQDESHPKTRDMNQQRKQENRVLPHVITVRKPVTHQREHTVQRLNIDDYLRESDLLTGRQFVLNTGNQRNETQHKGSNGPNLIIEVARLEEDADAQKGEHEYRNEDRRHSVTGVLVKRNNEVTVLVILDLGILLHILLLLLLPGSQYLSTLRINIDILLQSVLAFVKHGVVLVRLLLAPLHELLKIVLDLTVTRKVAGVTLQQILSQVVDTRTTTSNVTDVDLLRITHAVETHSVVLVGVVDDLRRVQLLHLPGGHLGTDVATLLLLGLGNSHRVKRS